MWHHLKTIMMNENAGTMRKTIQEAARIGKFTQRKQVHLVHAKVIGKEGVSMTEVK